MRLRRAAPVGGDPISAFWAWWLEKGLARAELVLSTGDARRFARKITALVRAIHPQLRWEIGPGRAAKRALVVSGGGAQPGRRAAEMWARAAPPTKYGWEYWPHRQANPDVSHDRIVIAGTVLDFASMRFLARPGRGIDQLDVVLFHPAFSRLPNKVGHAASVIALDQALGEDNVVRWLGMVEMSTVEPPKADDVDGFRTRIAQHGGAIEPGWYSVVNETPRPRMAAIWRPLSWVDYPLLDTYVTLTLPRNPEGTNGDAQVLTDALKASHLILAEKLEELDDRICFAARCVTPDGVVFRLYADHDDTATLDELRSLPTDVPHLAVEIEPDPTWRFMRRT